MNDPDEEEEEIIVEIPRDDMSPISGAGVEASYLDLRRSSPDSRETDTLPQPASEPAVETSSHSESGGEGFSTSSNSPIGIPVLRNGLSPDLGNDFAISIQGLEEVDVLDKLP